MQISVWFWVIYILALLFCGFGLYRSPVEARWGYGGWFITWILIGLLGWKLFGGPVQG